MSHTPGPWKITDVWTPGMWHIAATVGNGTEDVAQITTMDNARLIAAAPELLSTLETLCGTPVERLTGHDWMRANAAIAKATTP